MGWMRLCVPILLATSGILGCGGGNAGAPATVSPPTPEPVVFDTFQAASVVIGQADFTSGNPNRGGAAGANTSNFPGGVALGGLFVAEWSNNRVLGFHSPPTANGAAADFVLGQPDFTTVDTIGAPTATKFEGCTDVCVSDGRLFMVSAISNRVLIWDTLPTATGTPANVVLGQPDFTSNASGLSQTRLDRPTSVCVAGGKVLVADYRNNRVLIWTSVPTANNTPADLVLGQAAFNTNAITGTASSMARPGGVWTDGTRVAVADSFSSRVLIWNSFPTSNGQPADLVLGWPDFQTIGPGIGASGLSLPFDVCSNGVQLFVTDPGNDRVLIWNSFPTAHGQPADVVLGQGDFNHDTHNDDDQDGVADPAPSRRTFAQPGYLRISGKRLFVADQLNHRTLIFDGN